jgi:hypothetical protein
MRWGPGAGKSAAEPLKQRRCKKMRQPPDDADDTDEAPHAWS